MSYIMERLYCLAATRRVEFVDRKRFLVIALVQGCLEDMGYCLEMLVPRRRFALMQSHLISLISSKISLIFSYLILRSNFPNGQQSA